MFPPLLGKLMLHDDLANVVLHEYSDESGIPEFTGDPEIFTTAHQCVGLASFGCGRNTLWIEILHLTSRDRDKPAMI